METGNFAFVVARGDKVTIINPNAVHEMTHEQALNLAAYLIILSGASLEEFKPTFDAILSA